MTLYNTKAIKFTRCKGRKIHLNFDGGVIASDAGSIFLNRIDRMIGAVDQLRALVLPLPLAFSS